MLKKNKTVLVTVGTRVRLKNTGEIGIVNQLLQDQTVSVYLENGNLSIVAAIDDLENPNAKMERHQSDSPIEEHIPVESNVALLSGDSGAGLSLIFVPRPEDEGRSFNVHLLNTEDFHCSFTLAYFKQRRLIYKKHGVLRSNSQIFIDVFEQDNLSLGSSFDYELRRLIGDGTAEPRLNTIKLKAKTFFSKVGSIQSFPNQIILFKLVDSLPDKHVNAQKAEKLAVIKKENKAGLKKVNKYDPKAYASFNRELDIHIEALRNDHAGMAPFEIFETQLKAVEQYLDKAIKLGVDHVFVIHGKGSGKLKNAVHDLLRSNRHVKKFESEYYQKYGVGGATKVIFR